MGNNWQVATDDDLSQFPSAVSPLTAMGIDPDEARANPEMMARLTGRSNTPIPQKRLASGPGAILPQPDGSTTPSEMAAGQLGGARDAASTGASGMPSVPATSAPTDAHGYGMEGLGLLDRNLKSATDETSQISTTTPADIARLSAQQEKLEQKTPLRDASGKMLDQYKPSTGSRILRGIRSGIVGLATGGIPGAIVGAIEPADIRGGQAYGAPNKSYERAEDSRQQQLAATGDELKTAQQIWRDVNEARKTRASEFRSNATLGKDLTTGATGLINAENKPETEQNKAAARLKLNQDEFDQRRTQLSQDPALAKMSPLNKTLYLLNGKVPDPREPNEAEINAAQAARALVVFTASHGGKGPQTLEDFNQIQAAARGQLDKGKGRGTEATPQQLRAITDKKAAGIEAANKAFAGRLYAVGAKEQYQRQLQEVQNAFEEDMSLYGQAGVHNVVSVDQKGHVTWTPEGASAAAAPPAAAAAQPPAKIDPKNLPKQVMVKGKGMRNVIGYNDKTGKVIVAPEGQ